MWDVRREGFASANWLVKRPMSEMRNLGEEGILRMMFRRFILEILILRKHLDNQSQISSRQIRYWSMMPYPQFENQ